MSKISTSAAGPMVTLNCSNHHELLTSRLWSFLSRKHRVDLFFQWGGRPVEAHELILEVFLTPESLEVNTADLRHLDILLEFLYRGRVSVPKKELDSLMNVAEQLDLKILLDAIRSTKITDSSSSEAPVVDHPIEDSDSRMKTGKMVNQSRDGPSRASDVHPLADNSSDDDHCMDDGVSIHDEDDDSDRESPAAANTSSTAVVTKRASGPPSDASSRTNSDPTKPVDGNCPVAVAFVVADHSQRRTIYKELIKNYHTPVPTKRGRYFNCRVCHHSFYNNAARDAHTCTNVYAQYRTFDCHHCDYSGTRVARFLKHLALHEPDVAVWMCQVCNKAMTSARSLERHMFIHAVKRLCPHCNFSTVKPEALNHHLYSIHRRNANNEPLSGKKKIKGSKNVTAPAGTPTRPKTIFLRCADCGMCNHSFHTDEARVAHVCSKVYAAARVYECHYCSYFSTKRTAFMIHISSHDPSVKLFKCSKCKTQVLSREALDRHMLIHAAKRQCPNCDFSTYVTKNFSNHMLSRHKRNVYNQPIRRKSQDSDTRHPRKRKVEDRSEPSEASASKKVTVFGCAKCNCAFLTKTARANHACTKIKCPQRLFKCQFCNHETVKIASSISHMATHKCIECPICKEVVEDTSALKRHMAEHYSCPHCDYCTDTDTSYHNHLDTVHKIVPTQSPGLTDLEDESVAAPLPLSSAVVLETDGSEQRNVVVAEFHVEGSLESLSNAPIELGVLPIVPESSFSQFEELVNLEVDSPAAVDVDEILDLDGESEASDDGAGNDPLGSPSSDQCDTLSSSSENPIAICDLDTNVENSVSARSNSTEKRYSSLKSTKADDNQQKTTAEKPTSVRPKVFSCMVCKQAFQTKSVRDTHECRKNNNPEKTFVCHHCPYKGLNIAAFFAHLATHDANVSVLQCSICSQPMLTAASLERHMRAHHNYSCPHCPFTTDQEQSYQTHLLSHSQDDGNAEKTDGRYRCEQCDYSTKFLSCLTTHQSCHDCPEGSFKCNNCNIVFLSETSLAGHLCSKKPRRKLFNCELCKFRSDDKDRYLKHMKKQHKLVVNVFQCPYCSQFCARSDLLEHHKRTVHNVQDCLHCKFETDSSEKFQAHMTTYHQSADPPTASKGWQLSKKKGEKTDRLAESSDRQGDKEIRKPTKRDITETFLFCKPCNHAFLTEESLEKHACRMVKGRCCIYICPKCAYETNKKARFLIHFAKHDHTVVAFRCNICRTPYVSAEALVRHKRTHRMYNCQHCSFETPIYNKFYCHMRAHKESENDAQTKSPANP